MNVGFSVESRAASVEFKLFAPDNTVLDNLVTFYRSGTCSAVLMGRLHYRRNLLANLDGDLSGELIQASHTNDAALALALYCQSGMASLPSLEGDFTLVIWDGEARKLLGMRDPMGGYPLFWIENDDTIAFSSSLQPLLRSLPEQLFNAEYFADFLMMTGPRNEGPNELCAYKNIHRVLPGTIVDIQIPGRHIERRCYWDWQEHIIVPVGERLDDIAGQYAAYLLNAVQERIHKRTLAHLSGGMDSTAVALIARNWIHSGSGEAPLHTVSLIYDELPGLARERPYIENVLQNEQEIVAHRLLADDLLDYDSFKDAPMHDEPYAGLWRLSMDRATVAIAVRIGAGSMLTGLGADDMLEALPFYLADLLKQGRCFRAWREASRWARFHDCSPWGILRPFGIQPLTAARLPSGIRNLRSRWGQVGLNRQNDWTLSPWIEPDFARRYDLQTRAMVNARQTYRACRQTGLSIALSAINNLAGDVLRWSVAAPQGIQLAHPFLDRRLLCLGLGIQSKIRPEPGRMKPILAEAMRDILPEPIRNRRRKGHFNEIYYLGLARNKGYLEAMIRQAPLEGLGLFDKNKLIDSLREASIASVNPRQLQRLDFTLSLIKWLCMQGEGQQIQSQIMQKSFYFE